MTQAREPARYARVNGLDLYYEMHRPENDAAPPVVLLHGDVGGIAMFGSNLPSRLAILPGTTHDDILGTDAVARIALWFLDQQDAL